MNDALVISHMGLGDMIGFNPAINYLTTKHQYVYIYSKKRNYKNVIEMYKHNKNIKIICLSEHADDNMNQEYFEINKYTSNLKNENDSLVLYTAGNYNPQRESFIDLPDHFYKDIKLDFSIYDNYFKISDEFYQETSLSKSLPDNFIFTVSKSSTENISEKIKNNIKSNHLVINTFQNLYDETSEFYEVADKFINLPIFEYVPIIQKAKELHIIDSAFSLLCKFISTESQEKFLYKQSGYSLSSNFFRNWTLI